MNDSIHHPPLVETSLLEYQELPHRIFRPRLKTRNGWPKPYHAPVKSALTETGGQYLKKDAIFPTIVFSPHHEHDISRHQKLNSLVPYPDEIMAILLPNTLHEYYKNRQEEHANGRDGSAYWNWKRFEFKAKGAFYLLYGDDVSDEALDKIQKLLTTLLEEQPAKP